MWSSGGSLLQGDAVEGSRGPEEGGAAAGAGLDAVASGPFSPPTPSPPAVPHGRSCLRGATFSGNP